MKLLAKFKRQFPQPGWLVFSAGQTFQFTGTDEPPRIEGETARLFLPAKQVFRYSLRPWQLGAILAVVSAVFFGLGIWVMR